MSIGIILAMAVVLAVLAMGYYRETSSQRDDRQPGENMTAEGRDGTKTGVAGFMDAEKVAVRKTLERRYKAINSGQFWVRIPLFQKIVTTDARVQTPTLEPIQFAVDGRVTMGIGYILRFRVVDPIIALVELEDYTADIIKEAGLLIRQLCTQSDIDFFEENFNQEALSAQLMPAFAPIALERFGLEIVNFAIDQIVHSEEIRAKMASVVGARLDAEREDIRTAKFKTNYAAIVAKIREEHPDLTEREIADLAVSVHGHNAGEDSSGGMMLGMRSK